MVMSEVKVIVKCSHIVSQSAQIERVAVTQRVAHRRKIERVEHRRQIERLDTSQQSFIEETFDASRSFIEETFDGFHLLFGSVIEETFDMPPNHRGFILRVTGSFGL